MRRNRIDVGRNHVRLGFVGGDVHADRTLGPAPLAREAQVERVLDAAEVLLDDRISEGRKGPTYQRRVLQRVRPAFLSVSAYCAIRVPMVLPSWLGRAYVGLAWQAHRLLADSALGSMAARARLVLGAEHWLLGILLAALVVFWGTVAWTGRPPGSR